MLQLIRIAGVALMAACSAGAFAQAFPSKPMRIIVAFPPGGPIDIVARMLSPRAGELLGQQALVENRAGANGIIGADHVAKSAPDGYTMILSSPSSIAISPAVYPKMPFDTLRDLATVTLATTTPELLVVHPSVPVHSVKALVALAKARPGQLNLASTGSGGLPHLALELLKTAAKADMTHVPYNGAAPSVSALLGGHAHGMFADLPVLLPHVQAGKLRALAVASPKRAGLLPDLPTMTEQGLPTVEAVNWYGILVPSKTPRDVIAKLHDGFTKTLADAGVRERLVARGAEPLGSGPDAFGAMLKEEMTRWAKLVQSTNIKVD
jgi:tripartite-type tricarboxylate transporter receptor subunit TctC